MLLPYLKKLFAEAGPPSWRDVNGVYGGIAGVVGTIMIPLQIFDGTSRWANIGNGVISLILYIAIAWLLLASLRAIFVSPFISWRESRKKIYELEKQMESPLQIIFDPANPARRFWSLESGTPNSWSYWEHRIEVRNISGKTVKNVRVITEHLGQVPVRPNHQPFDINKAQSYDLHPGTSALVPISRWPNPKIQPGMLAGESAWEYGPIKVTVSGDDVQPSTRTFRVNWEADQMLFD